MTRLKFNVPHALTLIAALVPALVPATALATQPTPVGGSSTSAQAGSRGAMSIGSNGSALSYASSSQSATAQMTNVSASRRAPAVAGEVTTRSSGMAYNTSTGAASGMASATGSVGAQVQGGASHGRVGGIAATQSDFAIVARRNQGSAVEGNTAAGFEAAVQRGTQSQANTNNTTPSAPGVSVNTNGYVAGSNATSALQGMTAADVARIDASGFFNAKGKVGASPSPDTTPHGGYSGGHGGGHGAHGGKR